MLLAGDIGGTKTHLALFDGHECIKEERYASGEFSGLKEIVDRFHPGKIERACFGVAGPVKGGKCQATNLPWIIDVAEFEIAKVALINDLEATAWGVRRLKPEEMMVLNKGRAQKGNRAVIAAGTGLGEAGLYWDGKHHHPFACEGGHVDFAPRDEQEVKLWSYLKKKYGHVSYERVVSGHGLEQLYGFYLETGRTNEQLEKSDLPRHITEKALRGESRTCREIVDWFIALYGSAAGNLALKLMAVGGVFIGGGIAPKIATLMNEGEFMRAFIDKGRFKSFLSDIPVKLILNDNAALLGAAEYAEKL
jgi:glucokinase